MYCWKLSIIFGITQVHPNVSVGSGDKISSFADKVENQKKIRQTERCSD